ncbi:hypothetical protein PAXRUDRAFT_176040 [Paxillus rubicundulus Ve08.2h10]|uniref:Uncharacterized protein n=1 Tax=Paxillus rubicundulus Ve08.2h10 TaxID=930991 RepID=A0A0D0DAV6_9AGAM|nr:hypothetical protein PAXRUDRAFT_176040 [Paxillus rubicundulus Ve08.2h10]
MVQSTTWAPNMNRGTLHTHQMSQSPPATTDSPEEAHSSDTNYQTDVTPSRSCNAHSMRPHSLRMMSPQSRSPIALCTWIDPTLIDFLSIDTSIPMDQDIRPTPPTLLDPPSGEGNNPPLMPPQSSVAMGEVPTPTHLTPANPLQGDHPFPTTTVPAGGPNPPDPPQCSAPMSEDPTPTPLTPVDPPQSGHPLPATTVPAGGPSTLPMPPQGSVPMDEDPTPAPLTPVDPPQGDHPLPTTTVPMGGPNPPDPPQCSAPMEHNPVLPHQTNSTPSSTRPSPARPLPLPPSLDTVIEWAVAHHLNAVTAEIVKPTVQGIVNACIPVLPSSLNLSSRYRVIAT